MRSFIRTYKFIFALAIVWIVFLEAMFYFSRWTYRDNSTAVKGLSGAVRFLAKYEKIGGGTTMFGTYDMYTLKNGETILVYRK